MTPFGPLPGTPPEWTSQITYRKMPETAQEGSKMTPFGPLQTPSEGHSGTPFLTRFELFWAKS